MADEEFAKEKESFLSGEDEEPSDEKSQHMREGKEEVDVYSEEGREELIEEGEISPTEEGFMKGAEGLGKEGHCANCDKMLKEDSTIETEIDGERYLFCSDHCVEEFKKKK
ncbi:hypothetical protein ACFLZ7_02605 [Nanoarchaeota archaeon]